MSPAAYAPGTFCWAELATSDAEGAKSFYGALMGWDTRDDPLPGGGAHTMIRLGEHDVGALYELGEEMRAAGMPPHWLSYVSVADAAECARQAAGLGGAVVKHAFHVFDAGRMAVLADPLGAAFAVWEPRRHVGYGVADGRPGTVCWHELATRDRERAGAFYAGLFGWGRETMETDGRPYTLFTDGDARRAGMLEMTEQWGETPSHWMVCFAVEDCDAVAENAAALGGTVHVPPTDIPPVGRFSVISDPQGGTFWCQTHLPTF